jgi:anti-anti-sigma factor
MHEARLVSGADGPVERSRVATLDADRPILEVRQRGGIFFLSGELDAHSAAEFRRTVGDEIEGRREVVLDVAELSFIDSTGARTIALFANRLDGCSLIVRYQQDAVLRVLELLQVDEMPNIRIET